MAQSKAAAAAGIIDNLIDRLMEFDRADLPVISLYLDARANENGRSDFDRFLRKEFAEQARTYAPHTPERDSFERDVERINEYLSQQLKNESNGIAIFACSGANDFFEAVQFEAPIEHHQLYIYEQPHLYPLARVVDQYPRYAVLVADTNRARIFVFGRGQKLKSTEVNNVKTRRSRVGGWSQMRYQRHTENYHQNHAKEVIEVLERTVTNDGIAHVILAGDEVIIPLLKQELSKEVAERVVDVLSLQLDSPEHEILAESAETMRAYDAQNDAEKVKQLLDDYRGRGLAVVGTTETLEALSMGQVEELFITARQHDIEGDKIDVEVLAEKEIFDPVIAGADGGASRIEPEHVILADDLIRRAQLTSARITFIEDASLLAEFGGVGALLRYRIEPAN